MKFVQKIVKWHSNKITISKIKVTVIFNYKVSKILSSSSSFKNTKKGLKNFLSPPTLNSKSL